jgi:aspartate/methionine/tyrosine aminotransferase
VAKRKTTFRSIPYMGIAQAMVDASQSGYRFGRPDWCNLGQGQPDVGRIEGAPNRLTWITLEPHDHSYGPAGGIDELKQAVADHYNRLYRPGEDFKYKKENVSIASGGRLMLSRIFTTFDSISMGYKFPDSAAYHDLLTHHLDRIKPVPVQVGPDEAFRLEPAALGKVITSKKLNAFLIGNPCNPTGDLIRDGDLKSYLTAARKGKCTLIMDESYSHFIYGEDGAPGDGPVSAAAYVRNVEKDPVLIVDGLSKNFRYPGWRLSWVVGPSRVIQNLERCATGFDGGPSLPAQRLAIKALDPERADEETGAVRRLFARKRNVMLEGLESLGIRCEHAPGGTFYVWADLSGLPKPFNDAGAFFDAGLKRKVVTVPGRFFDVNPGGTHPPMKGLKKWVRFSFGPSEDKITTGLERLGEMIEAGVDED